MHIVRLIVKTLLFALLAIVLLVSGTVVMLYSPWTQDMLRNAVVQKFGSGDTRISLDSFRLRPPFRLEAGGVCMLQNGDTLMAARSLTADVALLPLLRGTARVDRVALCGGFYRIGASDSAMCLTIHAGEADIAPAEVELASMGISVDDGRLRDCRVDMLINPDTTTTTAPADSTAQSEMTIKLRRMRVENLQYSMRMLPTIDSLGATMADAELLDGFIDMRSQEIALRSLNGTGLQAAYITPDSATIAATPVTPESTSESAPWTVRIDSIAFDRSKALYTTRGMVPQPGLDFAYIAVDSLSLGVKDFYNRASAVVVPLRVSGTERCGLRLDTHGTLRVDSTSLRLDTFALASPGTTLDFSYMMGMGDLSDPSLPIAVDAKGRIATATMRSMFPAFTPYLATLPAEGIALDADVSGIMGKIDIGKLDITMNGCVALRASGSISNPMLPDRMGADIRLDGRVADAAPIARSFLDPATLKSVNIPPMTLGGRVWMRDGSAAGGKLTATTHDGHISLDGTFDSRGEIYHAYVDASDFPVNAFMPLLGVGRVTAAISTSGRGLDLMSATTQMKAHAEVASAEYSGHTYKGISADARLADGNADVELVSTDPDMLAHVTASGNLTGAQYAWEAYVDADRVDLKALNFSQTDNTLNAQLRARATYEPSTAYMSADINLDRLQMRSATAEYNLEDIQATLAADSTLRAGITNRDFHASALADCPLDTLLARSDSISAAMAAITTQRRIDAARLQHALPRMTISADGARDNFVNDILAASKMSVDSLTLRFSNDSTMAMSTRVLGVRTSSIRIDTVGVDMAQFGNNIFFNANADNRPGTLDNFAHVALSGMAMDNIAALRVRQSDIKGKTGYDIGLQAALADSTVRASIMPLDPTIGYQAWTVNAGNFISYRFPDKHIDADIRMKGAGSALNIFTEHVAGSHEQEDLVVQIQDIHVQDWLALNPFAPPVKGDVSADMRFNFSDAKQLNGRGSIDMKNFYYGRERVADIHADADVTTTPGGALTASADISFDGHRAITLRGALNDSTLTSPMNLDLSVIHLPLSVANPFLGADMGRLNGTLNGSIDIEGTTEKPTLNGWLALDSAAVYLAMTATDYRITADTVPVVNNFARLKDFSVYGVNNNPISLNGTVDISDFASPQLDLAISGNEVQLVGSRRAARGADVYGKAFIDIDATAKGNFEFMRMQAALKVLSGTNVTYVMPQAVETLQSHSTDEMVKFVNFNDSTAMAEADSIARTGMAMVLDASVTFEPASTISVDLSADGKDKAQLQPTGELSYTLTPMNDNGRLSGRLNINAGFVRYTPPVMSEQLFKFAPDSYVAFTGNMMNPTLNIKAVDVMK
ncbi:MAG: translocation/assembly module TamB, partial [Muribaculaceae bacterium]|nr:translocation/assembly module TamB [Muribaculaceae bacterium]